MPSNLASCGLLSNISRWRRRPGHEQKQHPLGLGRVMRRLGSKRPVRHGVFGRRGIPVSLEQVSQRDCPQPDSALLEKPAAVDEPAIGVPVKAVLAVHGVASSLELSSAACFDRAGDNCGGPCFVRRPQRRVGGLAVVDDQIVAGTFDQGVQHAIQVEHWLGVTGQERDRDWRDRAREYEGNAVQDGHRARRCSADQDAIIGSRR